MTGFRPILGLVLRYLCLVALLLVFLWKFPPAGKDYSKTEWSLTEPVRHLTAALVAGSFGAFDDPDIRVELVENDTLRFTTRRTLLGGPKVEHLTFRYDNFCNIAWRLLVILLLWTLVCPPFVPTTRVRKVLSVPAAALAFCVFFLFRCFTYGFLAHIYGVCTIGGTVDPVFRALMCYVIPMTAAVVQSRGRGPAPVRPAPQAVKALLLLAALCLVGGCRDLFSNNRISISIGGETSSFYIAVASFVLGSFCANLVRELRHGTSAPREPAKPSAAPPRAERRGFTQRQIAKWFQVTEREVKRWDAGEASPPPGYTPELRKSGDWTRMEVVLKAYWDLKRSQGGDAWSSKRIVHGLSDEAAYRMRPR